MFVNDGSFFFLKKKKNSDFAIHRYFDKFELITVIE